MSAEIGDRIASCFAELQDPCQPINQAHLFIDLLVISICAIVCGADDWEAAANYAAAKEEWLANVGNAYRTYSCIESTTCATTYTAHM